MHEGKEQHLHAGHRKRMYAKLNNDDGLQDHEVLEMLLYNAYPRKNTNPVAHNLLNAFGSIAGVFSATPEQLMSVEGVGESVANYLKCVGECVKRVRTEFSGIAVISNHSELKEFASLRLRGKTAEVLEVYCIDKSGRVRRIHSFTDDDRNGVKIGSDKINEVLVTDKPFAIGVAHNHLSGSANPSQNDKVFTAQIQFMCSMANVRLYDHFIYASDKIYYSFFESGELDKLKKEFSFGGVINAKVEKLLGPPDN